MSFKKISLAVLALGTLGLAGVTVAEAKNCQRLCRKSIAHYRGARGRWGRASPERVSGYFWRERVFSRSPTSS
jgi:hypothetical protein